MPQPDNPLIVQSDRTLLLDVHAPRADECRNALIPFAELERSPEHLHTYRITALSLWNAASAGFSSEQAVQVLEDFARYPVPEAVAVWIQETALRFGKIRMVPAPDADGEPYVYIVCANAFVYKEIASNAMLSKHLVAYEYKEPENNVVSVSEEEKRWCFLLRLVERGTVKQQLLSVGWPVKDDVPLQDGQPLELSLKDIASSGNKFEIRDYQKSAALALVGDKGPGTGFGTIVLPCGAGKTIVGMLIMSLLKTNTLIVTTNISAVHQWIDELLDKTSLTRDHEGLRSIPGVKLSTPPATFYCFADFSAYIGKSFNGKKIANSFELADYLLNEAHVATVAGGAFGVDSCIRMSYVVGFDRIEEAFKRLKEALKKLQ